MQRKKKWRNKGTRKILYLLYLERQGKELVETHNPHCTVRRYTRVQYSGKMKEYSTCNIPKEILEHGNLGTV